MLSARPSGNSEEARAIVEEVLAVPAEEALPPAVHEVIWADTPWPGHRTKLGDLQIDVGSGDPLAIPPVRITIDGISLVAVAPETMFGWKVHGLVEQGHGKWKSKDLLDLYLIDQHCAREDDALVASIHIAFTSRDYPFTTLDRFLYTDQWGRSRGSRRKWETFQKRWKGAVAPPALGVVASYVRTRITPLIEAAARLPASLNSLD